MSAARQEQMERNAAALTRRGVIAATVLGGVVQVSMLLGPLAGVVGGVAVILAVVVHGIALRIGLVAVAEAATGRDFAARIRRWLLRLSYLAVAPFGYSLMLTPIVGLLAGPITVATTNGLVRTYLTWSIERDRAGEGLHVVERALVILYALLLAAAFGALVLMGAAVGGIAALVASS